VPQAHSSGTQRHQRWNVCSEQRRESIVIEQNLTSEENDLIALGLAEYENNPDSFISLENVK